MQNANVSWILLTPFVKGDLRISMHTENARYITGALPKPAPFVLKIGLRRRQRALISLAALRPCIHLLRIGHVSFAPGVQVAGGVPGQRGFDMLGGSLCSFNRGTRLFQIRHVLRVELVRRRAGQNSIVAHLDVGPPSEEGCVQAFFASSSDLVLANRL
jgi:hypothetical protein